MTDGLPADLLARLNTFVATRMGLNFPGQRQADLERGIRNAATEFGFEAAEPCARWLLSAPLSSRQIEVLAGYLTVGETYFFRDRRIFEVMESHILPSILKAHQNGERQLRVWCAGCCTGEEPYSIAILLSRMLNLTEWNVTILGTDINPRFLRKASEGVYSSWSFRDTPGWVKEGYFQTTPEGRFEVVDRIRRMVSFSFLNLAEDVYPALGTGTNAMDLIFCRNVLMYFSAEAARAAAKRFHRCLVEGGWLMVSPTEASHALFHEFSLSHLPGAILYRKDGTRRPGHDPGFQTEPTDAPGLPPVRAPRHRSAAVPVSKPPMSTAPPARPSTKPPVRETARPQAGPYEQALALYGSGRYAEAADALVEWLARDTDGRGDMAPNGQATTLLARACANQGKLAEALTWCDRALAGDKLDPGHHYLRAAVLQGQDMLEAAAASLRHALYLDPAFTMAYFAMGNVMLRQGRTVESRRYFENVLELLADCDQEAMVPESEGLTAGRLGEIATSTIREVSS